MKTCKYNLRRRNPKTVRRKINKSRRKKRDPRKKNTRKSTRKQRRKRGGGKEESIYQGSLTNRAQRDKAITAKRQATKYVKKKGLADHIKVLPAGIVEKILTQAQHTVGAPMGPTLDALGIKGVTRATRDALFKATETREYNEIKAMLLENNENKDGAFAGLTELAKHNTLARKWLTHASQPRLSVEHPGANPPFIKSLKDNRNTNTHSPDGKPVVLYTQPEDGS